MIGTLYSVNDGSPITQQQDFRMPEERLESGLDTETAEDNKHQQFLRASGFELVDEFRYRQQMIEKFAENGHLVSHEVLTLSFSSSKEPIAAILKPTMGMTTGETNTATPYQRSDSLPINTLYWIKSKRGGQNFAATRIGWQIIAKLNLGILGKSSIKALKNAITAIRPSGIAKTFENRKSAVVGHCNASTASSNEGWHHIRLTDSLPGATNA